MNTIHRISYAVAAITACAAPLNAQQKEAAPALAAPKEFKLPAKQQFTLPNGMKVTLVPFGSTPKVDVQLVVRAGNVDERADQVWVADIMADLLREGTLKRSATEVNTAAASMGGSINSSVSLDELTVSGQALSEHATSLIQLLSEVALQPRFPETELARIKQNRLRQLAVSKSQPGTLAVEKFHNVMFPNHPYGRYFPTEAMLQGYTIQQVRDFYDRNVTASRAHLFVAGQFDANALTQTIRSTFGSWKAGQPAKPAAPTMANKRAIYLIDRPGAVQSSMYIGAPTIDPSNPDYRALQVTNMLLGGAFGSRITRNIREDKGYTYSPFSTVNARYRNAFWAEIADVTTNVTGASLKEIFAEIDRLQQEPPSATELKGIQDNMIGQYMMQGSSRGGIISLLRAINLHGLPESYINDYVKQVSAVTAQEVTRVAKQYINDDNFTIVVVGDRKVVEDQLKPYGAIIE
ncbi:MAG TPA: pitrilysin family protein [Longimicrobiales bacterium]|nr:pitrilysin family protein [Longimicrobiales bacterium]